MTDFGGNDIADAVAVQADGKIVVAGYSMVGSNSDFVLARYQVQGGLTVGTPAFSINPKSVGQSTTVTATASDGVSGVAAGEYFVGTDPGQGAGTPMTFAASTMTGTIGTNLLPGVCTVSVRARDAAGNWSAPSSAILVVYNPTGGFATGGGWIVPGNVVNSNPGNVLPGLDSTSKANFGFVVKYQSGASTTSLSYRDAYRTGPSSLSTVSCKFLTHGPRIDSTTAPGSGAPCPLSSEDGDGAFPSGGRRVSNLPLAQAPVSSNNPRTQHGPARRASRRTGRARSARGGPACGTRSPKGYSSPASMLQSSSPSFCAPVARSAMASQ